MYLLAVVGPVAMALIAILVGPLFCSFIAQRWELQDRSWLLATITIVIMVIGIVPLNLANVMEQEKQHSLFVASHQAIYYELVMPARNGGLDFVMYCTKTAAEEERENLGKRGVRAIMRTSLVWLDDKDNIVIPTLYEGRRCIA